MFNKQTIKVKGRYFERINGLAIVKGVGILVLLFFCLSLIGCSEEKRMERRINKLIKQLKDENRREEALQELVEIGEPAIDPLIAALKDENWDTRRLAARALGDIGDLRAIAPLIVALKDSEIGLPKRVFAASYDGEGPTSIPIEEVANALKKIGKPAVEPMIAALKDEDDLFRSKVAEALGVVGDPRAVNPLIVALKDPESSVRSKVAEALGVIGDPRAVDPLIVALKDPEFSVQWEAAEALGMIGDPRAVDSLIVALQDKELRKVAVEALGKIGEPAIEPLIAALKGSSRGFAQIWITTALAKIGEPAVEPLIAALKNKHSDAREGLARALGDIEDLRAVNFLEIAFKDQDLEVIAGAYKFFILRGEQGTEATLIEALNKYGSKWMAEAFLNCGNNKLEEFARNWAKKRGYEVEYTSGSPDTSWGRKR